MNVNEHEGKLSVTAEESPQPKNMNVLVGNIPLPANRFLVDLNDALSAQCSLTHDPDAFWNMDGEYDLIHLHFLQ